MSTIIKSEVDKKRNKIKDILNMNVSEDRAFSYVMLEYIFGVDFIDQDDMITDGSNDGGIDFIYYDDEDAKVVLCQSKYTGSLQYNDLVAEFDKMYSTLQNFRDGNTGHYNNKLKRVLQNALDRLPDENSDNVEFNLFTAASIDIIAATKKIDNTSHSFSMDMVNIYGPEEIEKSIKNVLESLNTVPCEKVKIDRAKNYLEYESSDNKGIMCNVSSASIIRLYNKYVGSGLFDLNIRKYIRNKLVDTGIKKTLDNDRENFWFLNNGIIIACNDFDVDGDTINLYDFSIVNGGQTTTLISTYKGNNTKEFYIPCKIVANKTEDPDMMFFTKIAEATNSQKPIYARDLKSNTPEMLTLARLLKKENIYLEIKRGVKPEKKYKHSIKNDELAQVILSFALQRPGTSRSGKKAIFENSDLYSKIFKVRYMEDDNKKGFLLDIIDLFDRYKTLEKSYKENNKFHDAQLEILKNGKQTIFALMGVLYRLENGDITEREIKSSPRELKTVPFSYSSFLSNYKKDDLDTKLGKMITYIVKIIADSYQIAYNNKLTTSVSNYLKTDPKYYDEVVVKFGDALDFMIGEDLKTTMDIFKRK